MLGNIFDFLFKEVFWRKWLNIVSESKSPVLWKKVFKNTAIKTRTISQDLSVKLASCPSVMRLLLNTFKPDRSVPTAEDFALNIYFELLQSDFHLCNNNQIELWRIRNFASSVRKEWLLAINNSFIAYSGRIRPPIPFYFGHPFQTIPATHSRSFRPL